jgi:hypothetical protein
MSDLRLDEATRKALLGLMPFTQGGTMYYTPECLQDAPEVARASFKQRAFTRQEMMAVRAIYADDTIKEKQSQLWEICRKTIVGWGQVFDLSTGEPMAYNAAPDGGIDADLWETLPLVIRRELLTNVAIMSGLLQQEKTGLK